MRRKLKDSHGESLVELLASILIATMSVILLFTGIAASAHINKMSQAVDAVHYEDLKKAERQRPADRIATGNVKLTISGNEITIPVSIYGGEGTAGLHSFTIQ